MLTDAGEGLFQNCLHMLATLDDYPVEARNLQKGPFGIIARARRRASMRAWFSSPLIGTYADRHPGLRVHLSVLPEDHTAS